MSLDHESENIENLNQICRLRTIQEVPSQKLILSNEALQLKTFECSDEGKILIRSKRLLNLVDFNENESVNFIYYNKKIFLKVNVIFNSPIQSFIQIPYMPDEMAVVDSQGFVFWGSIGTTFSRSKIPHNLKVFFKKISKKLNKFRKFVALIALV